MIIRWNRQHGVEAISVFLLIFTGLITTEPASAQSVFGSIVGTVTDRSGAVVAGAEAKATQTETNATRTAATNGVGVFTLSTLPAGTYIVSISKSGFATFESRDIDLTINTTVRVDATLVVGEQSQTT